MSKTFSDIDKSNLVMQSNYNNGLPRTCFQLIQKVGSKGKYQFKMFIIFAIVYSINGVLLSNAAFMFYAKQFQCQNSGLLVASCEDYVCELSPEARLKYLFQQEGDIVSVVTDFGPFKCQDEFLANLYSTSVYFGSLCGLLIFSSVTDNWGRRSTLILTIGLTTLGSIIVCSSTNITLVVVGLILSGLGSSSSSNIVYLFYAEVVQNQTRQKYSVLSQLAYTIGSIMVTLLYYLIGNWRIISILTTAIPCLIVLFFVTIYVQQTPQFLLNGDNKKSLKALNRIGRINFKLNDLITQNDINNVKRYQKRALKNEQQNVVKISLLDLLRFPSLRRISINLWILNFLIYQMYYGPSLIIDEIGFNIFVTSFALQIAQLLMYIPAYPYIEKIKRKKVGIVSYFVAIVCSAILILNQKPQDCDICFQSVFELFVVLIFRVMISFYFMVLIIYNVELYPSSAAGLGAGTGIAAGTIGSTICPIILGVLQRMEIGFMLLFLMYGIIGIGVSTLLKQTQGVPITPQIQEVANMRQKALQEQQKSLLHQLQSKIQI